MYEGEKIWLTQKAMLIFLNCGRKTLWRIEQKIPALRTTVKKKNRKDLMYDVIEFEKILLEYAMAKYYQSYSHDTLKKIVNDRRKRKT